MRKSSSILILVSATQQGSRIQLIQIPKPIRNRQDRTGQAAVTNMAVILVSSSFLTCSKSLQGPWSQTQRGSRPCWGKLRHPYCGETQLLGKKSSGESHTDNCMFCPRSITSLSLLPAFYWPKKFTDMATPNFKEVSTTVDRRVIHGERIKMGCSVTTEGAQTR